jgi:hypothetical protein
MANIALTQGNRLPVLMDVLTLDGLPIDLTGCQVHLNYQNLRTGTTRSQSAIVDIPATAGAVRYEWTAIDTAEIGPCIGQWEITYPDGRAICIPASIEEAFEFTISAPVSTAQNIALFRPYIRTLIGDNHPDIKEYRAEQLDSAVRLVVNMGKVPGISLSIDGLSLTPPVLPDPTDADKTRLWARLVLNAAKYFLLPNSASYSYRTRPLSEMFGDQKHFVYEILEEINQIENPVQCF